MSYSYYANHMDANQDQSLTQRIFSFPLPRCRTVNQGFLKAKHRSWFWWIPKCHLQVGLRDAWFFFACPVTTPFFRGLPRRRVNLGLLPKQRPRPRARDPGLFLGLSACTNGRQLHYSLGSSSSITTPAPSLCALLRLGPEKPEPRDGSGRYPGPPAVLQPQGRV